MAGLLDFFSSPAGMGLLAGLGGYAAGARRGTPVNNLGRGAVAGLTGYNYALNQQQQDASKALEDKYRQMQIDQAQYTMDEAKRNHDQLNAFRSNIGNMLPRVTPGLSQQQMDQMGPEVAAFGQEGLDSLKSSMDYAQQPNPQATMLASLPDAALTKVMVDYYGNMFKAPKDPQLVTVQTPQGPMQRWMRPGESTGVDVGAPVDKSSALPWYVKKGGDGSLSIDPAYAALEKTKAAFGRPPAQPMAPVAYVDPATGQTVWGTITDARGKPAANYSPTIQGRIAQEKASGKVSGGAIAQARLDLPQAVAQGNQTIKLVDDLLKAPGFTTAVGASSRTDPRNYIPGTDATDFKIRLDQLKGQQFMQAYQSLKGGGQITEVEGKKATDALSRMNTASTEKEFIEAAREFQGVIRLGIARAKARASGTQQSDDPLGIR